MATYTQPKQSSRWLRKHNQYNLVDGYVNTTNTV